jgi:hypothetical protein
MPKIDAMIKILPKSDDIDIARNTRASPPRLQEEVNV